MRPHARTVNFLGGISALVLLIVAISLASCTPAQKTGAKARSAPETPPVPDTYAGTEACKECHLSSFGTFSETQMGRIFLRHPRDSKESLGCENCHGPSKMHVDSQGKIVGGLITFGKKSNASVERQNATCLTCHTKGPRVFWQGSSHESADIACTNCHTIMKKASPKFQLAKDTVMDTCGTCHLREKAQQQRHSHMPLREGKMTCTSCHDPHGTVTPALLKENSLNDTCYKCHAEKRGPFLWEHPPVMESCANCHDPHGSNHEKMLKLAKPRLCQQCHDEQRIHPSSPYGRDVIQLLAASAKFIPGRGCMNCHPTVHGSNHPSGAGFIR